MGVKITSIEYWRRSEELETIIRSMKFGTSHQYLGMQLVERMGAGSSAGTYTN